MPAPVPTRKPRVPEQRRVPMEGGGEALVMGGELMRRRKVRRVEREGEGAMLPPTEDRDGQGCDKRRQSDCLGRK